MNNIASRPWRTPPWAPGASPAPTRRAAACCARSPDRRGVSARPPSPNAADVIGDAMFFERIARHLEHVSELARHQIAYAEAAGDLTPGELTPDEAVDEVLLRAYPEFDGEWDEQRDRKSTRLNSSHSSISYAVFC